MRRPAVSVAALQRAIDGEVIVPGSPAYGRLPGPFNARFGGVLPRAVVCCASAGDVAETVRFMRRHGLESAARSGGHCFAGRSATPGIVIDVTPMNRVMVTGGVATVAAGARLGEVYLGLLADGVTIPGGSCPSVGIAGLTLGGGLGMLGRAHGLTSDHLLGARIVAADGRVLSCDDHHEEELFWALRGAGAGQFGVVTDLDFRPVAIPAATTVFHLRWPFSDAAAVTRAWVNWAGTAPGQLAASLVLSTTADPAEPPLLELFGNMLGTGSDAAELLEQLAAKAGADPDIDLLRQLPYRDMLQHWANRTGERLEPPYRHQAGRNYYVIKSEFFARPLPGAAIGALLAHLTKARIPGQARELDFSPWGGAYNRTRADATAFVHRDALYSLKHTAAIADNARPTEKVAARTWAGRSWQLCRRWGTGRVFPNFPDPDLPDWENAYYGANCERLLGVKARYDPGGLFRGPQSLGARAPA
ncbi:MAG TPA: FAD-binding oxidoreductase [Streptosporangiaceae bacterium]